ncbi:MAG TPA: GntR family transcriptional regulator [Methylomusa anaerophila]|uniref:Mannosyl-D-glycerate transport/metabolism system repressor MngR n=1 Tax=Methylomusa anaerophila TaxID=1930071 RepID=A0A348AFZ4_9FIRM|nr:GntR family transcriptional regulator [Methylomusa anaerophila]BBB89992.1 mannosyl-D-glycerate transport/metabolism system repressor MngR [Methylomusa anaerophila]HML88279.1 GntR family transcriptional regulator [Methylomusa anaerophila]
MIIHKLGVPIYLQVKAYILEKINTGQYRAGDRLPTERYLAEELGISRNTVSSAYKELLLEGVLASKQGRGTFVREQPADLAMSYGEITGSRLERVLKVIDAAMAQVIELGFTVDQFAAIASIRAKEKAESVRQLRVAIVDCTLEYIQRFIAQIGQIVQARFETVILSELLSGKVKADLLTACDLVITTVEHQPDVSRIFNNSGRLMTVSVMPNLEAVIKLARLPLGTKAGVVAKSSEFAATIQHLLVRTGCGGINLTSFIDGSDEELRQFVQNHPVIIVAEATERPVRQVADEAKEIITFYYEMDQGSLQQVISRLASETQKAKEQM